MGGNMAFEEIRSGNVENIMLWRESLSLMQDSHFFDLLQMYLGEIKTPYNKPNLIEQLSSFLRKEETKQTMISLLSKEDLELLTAIYLIPKITQKKLLRLELFKKCDTLICRGNFKSNSKDGKDAICKELQRVVCTCYL